MEQEQMVSSQVEPVSPTPQVPKIKNSLVLIMSILLIVTVGIASLFYFQIQKLSKELSKYQVQPSPTPEATLDPTANWKTYSDTKYNFSFKYPQNWEKYSEPVMPGAKYIILISLNTDIVAQGVFVDAGPNGGISNPVSHFSVSYFEAITDISQWVTEIKNSGLINAKIVGTKTVNGLTFYEIGGLSTDGNSRDIFVKAINKGYLKLMMEPYTQQSAQSVFDETLSTFKFIEATPSTSLRTSGPSASPTSN